MIKKTPLFLFLLLLIPVFTLAQQTVYVKSSKAVIRGGTGFNGPKVETVQQNTALTVIEDSRLRLRVRTPSGNEGFIPKSQTQASPVGQSSGGGLGGFIKDDRDINEMKTASVNRGLTAENEELVSSGQISENAVQDLKESEDLSDRISELEIDSFLAEGDLGA